MNKSINDLKQHFSAEQTNKRFYKYINVVMCATFQLQSFLSSSWKYAFLFWRRGKTPVTMACFRKYSHRLVRFVFRVRQCGSWIQTSSAPCLSQRDNVPSPHPCNDGQIWANFL